VGSGTNIHQRTDAVRARIAVEGVNENGIGGGVSISGFGSDDNLLDTATSVTTSVTGVDLFPHVTLLPDATQVRTPIRIGPELVSHSLDLGSGSASEIDFISIGFAAEIEPQWTIASTDEVAFSIYGRARAGAGYVAISAATRDFSSTATNIEGEVGIRFQTARFVASLGFMVQETSYDESDVSSFSIVEATDIGFRGLFLSAGIQW
tara:strand:+ start:10136 stop:10756 length:621 start_codon:yes stop_codon:yes gene_type:complete